MNKLFLLGTIIISFLFLKCSKSSDSSGNSTKGNYIIINSDKRDLGVIPNRMLQLKVVHGVILMNGSFL